MNPHDWKRKTAARRSDTEAGVGAILIVLGLVFWGTEMLCKQLGAPHETLFLFFLAGLVLGVVGIGVVAKAWLRP